MNGYIKLNRKILQWEWYGDKNTRLVFLHCLLKANWQDKNWQGKVIEKGQFVTTIRDFAEEVGLTIQQTRRALNNIQTTNEITIKTTNKFSVITVVAWGEYQSEQQTKKQTNNKQTTHNSTNKQHTINEEIEEYKNNNIYIGGEKPPMKTKIFKPPTIDEIKVYCQERNNNIDAEHFFDFYESKGWMVGKNKMKDWKCAVRNWERTNKNKTITNNKPKADIMKHDYDFKALAQRKKF